MIKPQDIDLTPSFSFRDIEQQAAIEIHFDNAIRDAEKAGKFPARPVLIRTNWENKNILAVAARYKAAGWVVGSSSREHYATIDLPTQANNSDEGGYGK